MSPHVLFEGCRNRMVQLVGKRRKIKGGDTVLARSGFPGESYKARSQAQKCPFLSDLVFLKMFGHW